MIQRNLRMIDLSCIEENMRRIRSAVPESAMIMAVVKADGYGHGAACKNQITKLLYFNT